MNCLRCDNANAIARGLCGRCYQNEYRSGYISQWERGLGKNHLCHCGAIAKAKGMCRNHYMKARYHEKKALESSKL